MTMNQHELIKILTDKNSSIHDIQSAILLAEITEFDDHNAPKLVEILFDFCFKNRYSNIKYDIIILGSAIRKLALNMKKSDFERYAELLSVDIIGHNNFSTDVELELTKSLFSRLNIEENLNSKDYPKLYQQLTDIIKSYDSPRIFCRENYASIISNAVKSVICLEGREDHIKTIVTEIIDRGYPDWLRSMIVTSVNILSERRYGLVLNTNYS